MTFATWRTYRRMHKMMATSIVLQIIKPGIAEYRILVLLFFSILLAALLVLTAVRVEVSQFGMLQNNVGEFSQYLDGILKQKYSILSLLLAAVVMG